MAVKRIPQTINYDYTRVVFSCVRFLRSSEKWGSFVTTQTRRAAHGKWQLRNIPPKGFCWGMVRMWKTADMRKNCRCASVRALVQKQVHWPPDQVSNCVKQLMGRLYLTHRKHRRSAFLYVVSLVVVMRQSGAGRSKPGTAGPVPHIWLLSLTLLTDLINSGIKTPQNTWSKHCDITLYNYLSIAGLIFIN